MADLDDVYQLGERVTSELVDLSGTPGRCRLEVAICYIGEESKSDVDREIFILLQHLENISPRKHTIYCRETLTVHCGLFPSIPSGRRRSFEQGFGELEEEREEATVCRLFVFRPIGSSVQVVLSSFRSKLFGTFIMIIVAQKLRYGFELVLQLWDKHGYLCMLAGMCEVCMLLYRCCFLLVSVLIIDAFIEDERQYCAPHLPASSVVSLYETSG
ncbi:hypothetical protein F511_26470 [Dorcoceras hygrometricum]|uniref:Uncharacterized protein n=1 Tax=Dorcoceras hygrometricum TaxID=472368 RepID=A0A2Z7BDH3_9LAMI|nr:hypothetical protein F511_26470 [Dorcoceras hygrometricum]